MPARVSGDPLITVYRSANSLPPSIWNAFERDPRNSNIIFSHALKETHSAKESTKGQVWIACTTDDTLDYVLSCTHHAMGAYPVFIYSTHSSSTLDFVTPRVELLVKSLMKCVKVERVFSVFAVKEVSRTFAETWSRMTHVMFYEDPYYDARLTYCTRQRFRPRQPTMLPGISYTLRLAGPSDVHDVARLCHGFAAAAEPFVLSERGAIEEAEHLIRLNQLWVHTIKEGERRTEIASIVAVTREAGAVSAITKVFTNPDWRSRGCAERLVRKVTQTLLKRKESVVLYVAHDNPAASKVYSRVGFVGLDKYIPSVDSLDSWVEYGFDRNKVELGHW